MRKNIANLVGMTILSTCHWIRKNRLYSLLSLMFSVMLIMSSAAPLVQVASATVSSDQLDNELDNETAPIKVTSACDPSPAYKIEKCVTDVNCMGSQASVKEAGDVITYRITVTNTGDVDLTNVTVTDPLIETLTELTKSKNTDKILDSGEIWTYTGSYTVTQEDIDTNGGCDGYIDNVALVDCDQLEPKCDSAKVLIEETSLGDDSTADNSTADNSTADNSTADNSTADNSTADNSTADNLTDNDSSSGTSIVYHHSNGGTGEARIIPKPTKNLEVNETGNETQLGPDIKNFEQNTENAEADVEKEPGQESAGIPGFEIVYGAVGLLAAIFLYKRK